MLPGTALLGCALMGIAANGARAEHLIAVVVTEGSAHRPNGGEILSGARAAADQINRDGGVLGQPIRIARWVEDCTRERAVQVAEEIVPLKPDVVIGHLCPRAAMGAAGIYAKAGILFIAPGVRHPGLTEGAAGRPVLRLAGRDDRFAVDATRFIKSHYGGKSVAVIADRTRQGRGLADGVAAELRRQHVAVVLDERIESGRRSYDPVARRVRASGAGVVVMPAQPIELGVLIKELRRIGVQAPVVGSEILAVPAMEAVAREEGRRLVVLLPWTGVEEHTRSGGASPDDGTASDAQREAVRRRGEAAVQAWAAAAKRAGATTASAIVAAAQAVATPTAIGPLRFDAAGDAMVPSYVPSVWLNGSWQPFGD
jgi:branched-chain amino acid transport system substrate-binding protein